MLLSVPHSGRDYPDWLVDMAAAGRPSLAALEDPLVDRLVWRALQRGCGAVIARTPRAAIDCNRAEDELDPSVIDGARRGRVTARARGGLGIVPARTLQHGFLWRRAISPASSTSGSTRPTGPIIARSRSSSGCCSTASAARLLLDCHSMPPPPEGIAADRVRRLPRPHRRPWVSRERSTIARGSGFEAGLNDPFAGGHVIDRHARPARGVHALQIEIDRRCYLDETPGGAGPGLRPRRGFLETLAVELGEALLGRQFATAAE